ncbi:MAG TPA: hypothetical protein VHN59_02815 [Chitinophagaceae bacterium]|nr:hypothetical protein [Chitinophagaceae bacterium]
MTRRILGQFFCYFAALGSLWVSAGQIIQVNLTTDKLIRVGGIIDRTIEVKKKRSKSNRFDYELRIFLKDTAEYFRFMDIYNYDRFREKIQSGDSAEIFIRPKWLVPLGLGYRNDIFQMNLKGETIFDVSQTKRNNTGILIVSILAIPLFFFLGRYVKKKGSD